LAPSRKLKPRFQIVSDCDSLVTIDYFMAIVAVNFFIFLVITVLDVTLVMIDP